MGNFSLFESSNLIFSLEFFGIFKQFMPYYKVKTIFVVLYSLKKAH
jgi:hypothetical protein